jgi:hypothetical protein
MSYYLSDRDKANSRSGRLLVKFISFLFLFSFHFISFHLFISRFVSGLGGKIEQNFPSFFPLLLYCGRFFVDIDEIRDNIKKNYLIVI